MNSEALVYHNGVNAWFATKRLKNTQTSQQQQQKPQHQPCLKLTADKFASIGDWCDDVNRLFIDPPKHQPKHLFRKFKYSDAMFPPNKSTVRSKAVPPPAQLWSAQGPGRTGPTRSAVLAGKAGPKHVPNRPSSTKPTPPDDEKNTALSVRMNEKANHYTQERRIVHLNIHPEWRRKLSTGWTINRPLLYPKNPPPPPAENLLVDIPDYLVRGPDNKMEVVSHDGSSKRKQSANSAQSLSHQSGSSSDKPNPSTLVVTSEKATGEGCFKDEDQGGVVSKGTQCEAGELVLGGRLTAEAGESRAQGYKPLLSDRSTSNDILNVLSVDDCRMMMRHRPQRVIETQDTMKLPPKRPPVLTIHPVDEEEMSDIHEEDEDEEDKEEEDKEEKASGSQDKSSTMYSGPIRLSQAGDSARTTLSPSQVQSRVRAYRNMFDRCSKLTAESKVVRPSSAAVEKAFSVLLDRKFQAIQSSRRPLSSPPKVAQSRPGSRMSSQTSAASSAPSQRFQALNNTLRQQMYDYLDSHWTHTKLKFNRAKNGYTRSAMKKGSMITSSPKFSDDEGDL